MATFRKIVKNMAADYAVAEEGVVDAVDILTLAGEERKRREAAGETVILDGATYTNNATLGERVSFVTNGPGLGERKQVVLTTYNSKVFL
jgi:hypothetical protein